MKTARLIKRFAFALSAMLAFCTAQAASAAVLNFDDLTAPSFVNGFDYQGYTFTIQGPAYLWVGNSPNSNGTNNIIARSAATVQIERTDGGQFDLNNFNAALSWYNNNASNTLSVNGQVLNLTQSNTNFDLNLTNQTLVTLDFSGPGYWTADDFDLEFSAPVAVPAPAGIVLILTGFAGLGVARRRRLKELSN